jgi:hypothetical protein
VSSCGLLTKGHEATNSLGESVFVGTVAPYVSVLRASSIASAIKYYALVTAVTPPHFAVSRPEGVGDESTLLTLSEASPGGETNFGSAATVRVRNIVAQYALGSSGGSDEADPAGSLQLLKEVASRL